MPITQSQYATTDQLTLFAPAAAARASGAQQTAALQAASSLADGYIGQQFQLPLQANGWDMSLVQAVCSLAALQLHRMFGYDPKSKSDADAIATRAQEAIAFLQRVATKEIQPQWLDSAATTGVPAGPFTASPTRVFDPLDDDDNEDDSGWCW